MSEPDAPDHSTMSDEDVRALIWSKITPELGDPATIRLTLNVPITVARALTLIATLEERPLRAVALEGLAFYTGLERFYQEHKDWRINRLDELDSSLFNALEWRRLRLCQDAEVLEWTGVRNVDAAGQMG